MRVLIGHLDGHLNAANVVATQLRLPCLCFWASSRRYLSNCAACMLFLAGRDAELSTRCRFICPSHGFLSLVFGSARLSPELAVATYSSLVFSESSGDIRIRKMYRNHHYCGLLGC